MSGLVDVNKIGTSIKHIDITSSGKRNYRIPRNMNASKTSATKKSIISLAGTWKALKEAFLKAILSPYVRLFIKRKTVWAGE